MYFWIYAVLLQQQDVCCWTWVECEYFMADCLLTLDLKETQLCNGENSWSRHAQTDAFTRSNVCGCSERHAGAVNITLWPHQHVETPMRRSLSMNWSNPVLRWGHTSQPITTGLDIRHPALSQSTCLCFFFSPSPRSLPVFSCWVSFFLKYYFVSNVPPAPVPLSPPEAEVVTICWCVPDTFLFHPKLLSVCLPSLSAVALCATHSFTKYTMTWGKSLKPPKPFLLLTICVCNGQECHDFTATFIILTRSREVVVQLDGEGL